MEPGIAALEAGEQGRLRLVRLQQQLVDLGGDRAQRVQIVRCGMDGRQRGGVPFQHGAQLEDLVDLGAFEFGHEGAPAGLDVHQAFARQAAQAVPNGGARHADTLRKLFLQHALARQVDTVQDQLANRVVGDAAGACHGRRVTRNVYKLK